MSDYNNYGAKVEIDDGASNAYAVLANVIDLMPFGMKRTTTERKYLDAATLGLPSVSGTIDLGTIEVTVAYTTATLSRLNGLITAGNQGTEKHIKVTYPDGTTVVNTVLPKECTTPNMDDPDKETTIKFVAKVNSLPTVTAP